MTQLSSRSIALLFVDSAEILFDPLEQSGPLVFGHLQAGDDVRRPLQCLTRPVHIPERVEPR